MTAIGRMVVLDLRTIAPYRYQTLGVFCLAVLVLANKPTLLVPGLVLLVTSQIGAYPFNVADKEGLETLYAVLPLPRRSVLYGHYAWAVALFLATASVGTALAPLLARAQTVPLDGRTVATALTLSWALFAVNTGLQFPLLIRFGYTRANILGTTLPLAVVVGVIVKMHVTMPSIQSWLPLIVAGGAAAIVTSAAVAVAADRRRVRYGAPRPEARTARVR